MKLQAILLVPLLAACVAAGDTDDTSSSAQDLTDPYTVHAPMYRISMTVLTDTTANPSTEITKDNYSTGHGPYDEIRAGMGAYLESSGLKYPNPVTCIIGDPHDRGPMLDPENVFFTTSGGVYSTCMADPDVPDMAGRPLAFPTPVEVGPEDTIDLYARLEVLNSGDAVAPASDPTAGVGGGLVQMGGVWQTLGTIASLVEPDAGAVLQGTGAVVQSVGQIAQGDQRPSVSVCTVTNSLVPGFGDGQPQTDKPSPLFRVQLSGKTLWEQTANGDAALEYTLDWGNPSSTHLCQRPKTRIVYRIRRIAPEITAGDPIATRGGMLAVPYADQLDSFAVDASQNIIHDQWNGIGWSPSSENLTSLRPSVVCVLGIWCHTVNVPVFPARAHLSALAKAGGNLDIFGISTDGRIFNNWRNAYYDSNQWHAWAPHSGAYFPAGAPVAAISRRPGHIDVFAVANDGSIMTVAWDAGSGWESDAHAITPAGAVKPWDGMRGGGVAARATGTLPWSENVAVYAAGVHYELVSAHHTTLGGWQYVDPVGPQPPDLWYQPGSGLAVISRNGNDEIFFVDAYNHARETYSSSNGWQTREVLAESMPAMRGADVAAVERKTDLTGDELVDNDHIDFFTIGSDGTILHNLWRAGHNDDTWNVSYHDVIPTVAGAQLGQISAVAPYPGSIQVIAQKPDGSVGHTWFKDTELVNLTWETGP
jgi:hypothetical protein